MQRCVPERQCGREKGRGKKDTTKKKTPLTDVKFTIAGSQFIEFDVATFGLHKKVTCK